LKVKCNNLKDQHPIPNIQDQLLSLRGFKFFSKIDLNPGYCQIKINLADSHKTSFIMPFYQFEFVRMPFGITNAPKTFQNAINAILGNLPSVRVYLDYILIMGESEDIHNKNFN
ncbi:putative LTR transposable element, partial [Pseudoloma neurophilia]